MPDGLIDRFMSSLQQVSIEYILLVSSFSSNIMFRLLDS